jgi:hypothetical protein
MLIFQMQAEDTCGNIEELANKLDALMRYLDTRIFISIGITFAVLALMIWFTWYISKFWISHDWFKFLAMIFVPVITFYAALFFLLTPVFKQGDDVSAMCESENASGVHNVFCIEIEEVENCAEYDEFKVSEDYQMRYKATYHMPSILSAVPKPLGLGTILLCVLIPFVVFFINRRYIGD